MLQKIIASHGQNSFLRFHNRGMTLLEVLISLGIFGVVAISFMSFFANTNIGIAFSDERISATMEVKSLLDELSSIFNKNTLISDISEVEQKVIELLDKRYGDDYDIFYEGKKEVYKYNNRQIHCFINKLDKDSVIDDKNLKISDIFEIRVINFYDNGRKNVELSIYIPVGEDHHD